MDALLVGLYEWGVEWLEKMLEDDPSGALLTSSVITDQFETAGAELIDGLMAGTVTDPNHNGHTIDQYADALFGSNASDQVDRTNRLLRAIVSHEARCVLRLIARARGNSASSFMRRTLGRLPDRMGQLRASLHMLETGIHLDDLKKKKSSVFGLSESIRPDFVYGALVVGDLKVGDYHAYYDLVVTGYAIFTEFVFTRRVNNALLMFVQADLAAPDKCKINVVGVEVTNDRRVAWATQRDSALGIMRLPSIPSLPDDRRSCPGCQYRNVCWIDGEVGNPRATA